jgi:hypothetical protein
MFTIPAMMFGGVQPVHPASPTVFSTANTSESYTVPGGVNIITVSMWGAGGGGSQPAAISGGSGGYIKFDMPVTPGQVLTLAIGAPGMDITSGNSGPPGGNPGGGSAGGGNSGGVTGASGGGYSSVYNDGILIAIAGAGGGGAYTLSRSGNPGAGTGGVGGGSTGGSAALGGTGVTSVATGGTQSSGGVAGINTYASGNAGSSLHGGNGNNGGYQGSGAGGAGAGYFGGGSGCPGDISDDPCGGGGGSTYWNSIYTTNESTESGFNSAPGGQGDPHWTGTAGFGTAPSHGATAGLIVIY